MKTWRQVGIAVLAASLLMSGCASIRRTDVGQEVSGGPVFFLTASVWVWWTGLDAAERQAVIDADHEATEGTRVEDEAEVVLVVALALDVVALPLTIPIGLCLDDDGE
jgi:uncharacterized protein YceK